MGTVTELRRPRSQPAPGYTLLSPEARQAFAALEGRFGALKRIFSGPFASTLSASEIEGLCGELRIEAQRVARLAR